MALMKRLNPKRKGDSWDNLITIRLGVYRRRNWEIKLVFSNEELRSNRKKQCTSSILNLKKKKNPAIKLYFWRSAKKSISLIIANLILITSRWSILTCWYYSLREDETQVNTKKANRLIRYPLNSFERTFKLLLRWYRKYCIVQLLHLY